MKDFFAGKVVWITGASSGIGEALVKAFTRGGSRVIASSIDTEGLERVAGECSEMKGSITCVPFDLSDTSGIESLVKEVAQKEGRIDMLLNIGGISQRALLIETPMWLDRKIMEINYFGTIALTKALLPHMIAGGGGILLPPAQSQAGSASRYARHTQPPSRRCTVSSRPFSLNTARTTSGSPC